jgi:hypothetical protein
MVMVTCPHCDGTGTCTHEYHDENFDPIGGITDFVEHLLDDCPNCGAEGNPPNDCPHCNGSGEVEEEYDFFSFFDTEREEAPTSDEEDGYNSMGGSGYDADPAPVTASEPSDPYSSYSGSSYADTSTPSTSKPKQAQSSESFGTMVVIIVGAVILAFMLTASMTTRTYDTLYIAIMSAEQTDEEGAAQRTTSLHYFVARTKKERQTALNEYATNRYPSADGWRNRTHTLQPVSRQEILQLTHSEETLYLTSISAVRTDEKGEAWLHSTLRHFVEVNEQRAKEIVVKEYGAEVFPAEEGWRDFKQTTTVVDVQHVLRLYGVRKGPSVVTTFLDNLVEHTRASWAQKGQSDRILVVFTVLLLLVGLALMIAGLIQRHRETKRQS